VRQARNHHPDLPRADILTARLAESAGDSPGALLMYLKVLEVSPGLALEIIPAVLIIARRRSRRRARGSARRWRSRSPGTGP